MSESPVSQACGRFDQAEADREKEQVARNSVGVAIILTTTKAFVGFATNSLGILSEALHSGLDLVAAFVTWVAVRFSGKPADEDHQYGHGKIESISALFEILLLLLTSYWIILEAIEKLKGHGDKLSVSMWSFVVMFLSMSLDVWRSRVLYKTAKKYNSQALEADALHFSTDIFSSAVVIVGLLFAPWFPNADPISAIAVAFVILYACWDLGKEAMNTLLDKAPEGVDKAIREIALGVQGVIGIKQIRVRGTGSDYFADLTLNAASHLSFEEAHGLGHHVEKGILERFPKCHVQVHMEPAAGVVEDLFVRIRRAALCMPGIINLHNLELMDLEECRHVILHVEVDEKMPLSDAHRISTDLEKAIKGLDPKIGRVISHIEPATSSQCKLHDVTSSFSSVIEQVKTLLENIPSLQDCHNTHVFSAGTRLMIELHIRTAGDTSVDQAHKLAIICEGEIRKRFSQFSRITIHTEPLKHQS